MQARRASRELAFILFSQFEKNVTNYSDKDISELMVRSIRILMSSASDELKISLGALVDMKNRIEDYEAEHETNLNRPMGAQNIAVPVVMSSELLERINDMTDIAEKALLGLEIAEFATLDSQEEVKMYTSKIIDAYQKNSQNIDEEIRKNAKGWDFDRLVKTDKDILKIALAELLYVKETPMKVIVDEAVELAKKYSTDDSASFVNGILAKVIVDKGLE